MAEIVKDILRDIILPKGYKIVVDDSELIAQKKQEEIQRLQEICDNMTEPKDEELIMFGKMIHPFYQLKRQLSFLITNQ